MITESILNVWFMFLYKLMDALPVSDMVIEYGSIEVFLNFVDMAAYFVPMNTIIYMLVCIIAEEVFKIGISFMKFILKFIPFIG